MRALLPAAALLVTLAGPGARQVSTAAGALDAGTQHSVPLDLAEGDFVAGTLDQGRDEITLELIAPDGWRVRWFDGPPGVAREFMFAAEQSGTYRLRLTAPAGGGPFPFELHVSDRIGQDALSSAAAPERPAPLAALVASLAAKLAAGEAGATEAFWREVTASGTPLVEPLPDGTFRVTFLWRGETARSVELLSGLRTGDDRRLARLAGSDVWYKTIELPAGAHLAYSLVPDAPRLAGANRRRAILATAQADPLNPRRFPDDPALAGRFDHESVLSLPGAPPQPETGAAAAGTVTRHRLRSGLLGNERDIWLYTPAGYAAGPPAPLLILFDADRYRRKVGVPAILDRLVADGQIPPVVVAMVENPSPEARASELPCDPDFAAFLATELLPWIRGQRDIDPDPDRVALGGASYGGLAAACAAYRHPNLFGAVLAQSGSFWWSPTRVPSERGRYDPHSEQEWLTRAFVRSPRLPIRFVLQAGLLELSLAGEGAGILETTRHLRDVLEAKGYAVRHREFAGGHDWYAWRAALGPGLIELLGPGRD